MKLITTKLITVALAGIILPLAAAFSPFIRWVDCAVSYDALKKVYDVCRKNRGTEAEFDFADGIAYVATRNGNKFSRKDSKYINDMKENAASGNVAGKYADNKYYKYHKEAYGAILENFVGDYEIAETGEKGFGITAYFPIASGHWYNHYDDFGNSRSFGFKRKHLGHDIMGGVGTPIVAVEGGTVTELGWNRYGGWRVGITSLDGKRYYYYAHLRKGKPYADGLTKGARVEAGEVVGFLGATGYSDKEDVNLKNCAPHLHFGMQLIFDESQRDGNGEIWIDVYALCKFVSANRAKTVKDENGAVKSVNLRRKIS
jgi:murein DD-endopeptidase MepM/ murein hydrolase activator NlpD